MSQTFLQDVLEGLNKPEKSLSSKYFYDEVGSRIFQEIMAMESYYLPRCETEILQHQSQAIWEKLPPGPIEVLELGAGDGTKTALLLEAGLRLGRPLTYTPLDISADILTCNTENLRKKFPDLQVQPIAGDYFQTLRQLPPPENPRLFLFLGSNIGNFAAPRDQEFLRLLQTACGPKDHLLLGADLKKHPKTIRAAYADPAGITSRFNLNLLRRINRELGADFQLDQFLHEALYHPMSGAAESFLVSLRKQTVHLQGQTIHFQAFEAIHTETSQKYSLEQLEQLALASGFQPKAHFLDQKAYFSLNLWASSNAEKS
ncbi:MAG: L-histidine N(alpha)-methyltransferase [Nitritalea sp.]